MLWNQSISTRRFDGIACLRHPSLSQSCNDEHRALLAAPPVQLDDVSKAIIEQLQADGRRSYADIGKAVGLSEAAVRQRVQRLTESGVMQIVAVTDPMQLGFTRQAMIGIRAAGDTRVLAEQLAEIPEIDYVVLTAGSFDLLAEVVCENDEELITLLNTKHPQSRRRAARPRRSST